MYMALRHKYFLDIKQLHFASMRFKLEHKMVLAMPVRRQPSHWQSIACQSWKHGLMTFLPLLDVVSSPSSFKSAPCRNYAAAFLTGVDLSVFHISMALSLCSSETLMRVAYLEVSSGPGCHVDSVHHLFYIHHLKNCK